MQLLLDNFDSAIDDTDWSGKHLQMKKELPETLLGRLPSFATDEGP